MKKIIVKHFRENYRNYFILSVVLILGVVVGIIFVNNLKENQVNQINSYLTDFVSEIKGNNSINYSLLLENSIKNSLKFALALVLLSFSIWANIGTFALIGYKGFCLGYSISSAIAIFGVAKGLMFTISLILASEIIFIPAVFFISVYSMKNYRMLVSEEYDDKRVMILRYAILLLIAVGVIITSVLAKTYLSSNLFLILSKYF